MSEENNEERSMWQKVNDLFDKPPYLGIIVIVAIVAVGLFFIL